MKKSINIIKIVGFLGLALWMGGCSLALEWDPNKLPCENGQCDDGFTCLVHECIIDNSLLEDETCNLDDQCESPMICAPSLFTCLKECESFYKSGAACGAGRYCHPVFDENAGSSGSWTGVCVQSSGCQADPRECDTGEACVKISATADACLDGCEISWGLNDEYSDSCGSSILEQKYCQPIGVAGDEQLLCLDTRVGAAGLGQNCDSVTNPCQREADTGVFLACIDGRCLRHCNSALDAGDEQCASPTTCCARSLGVGASSGTYGFCSDSCSGN